MGKIKDTFLIEDIIFNTIEFLEKTAKTAQGANGKQLDRIRMNYQSGLIVLDQQNQEYQELTGKKLIDDNRVLSYHAKQWEF